MTTPKPACCSENHAEAFNPSRRNFLAGFATLGAGLLASGSRALAQIGSNARWIDFHHHFQTPGVMDLAKSKGVKFENPWSLSRDLEDMDKSGTETALLSAMGNPLSLDFGDIEQTRKVARMSNEYAAKLRADHPRRFGSFAALPWWYPDNDGILREIEYALDTLKADGIYTYTSYGEKYVGDPYWFPVYEELNRRRAIVYVHPHAAICCQDLSFGGFVNATTVEFSGDTTRVIARVLFSGLSKKFPNISWVFSHGGGTMPFVIERFLGYGKSGLTAEIVPGVKTTGQTGRDIPGYSSGDEVLRELRKYYYDTAQASNPIAMRAVKDVVGMSQIVYGTDYWYRSSVEHDRGLRTSKVFTPQELQAIARGNAERILPRYKTS
jgi:predicted TIM-barrel fold metal-dependent hydrolase